MSSLEVVGLEWLGALALFLSFILLVRYLDHRERMAMIDRGLMPPQRTRPSVPRTGSAALRGGLITMMVGLVVTLGLYTLGYLLPAPFSAVPGKLGPWLLPGLIPVAVGAALVVSHYLAPPHAAGSGSADPAEGERRVETPQPQGIQAGWRLLRRSAAAGESDRETRAE
jgi:hypothetical protein